MATRQSARQSSATANVLRLLQRVRTDNAVASKVVQALRAKEGSAGAALETATKIDEGTRRAKANLEALQARLEPGGVHNDAIITALAELPLAGPWMRWAKRQDNDELPERVAAACKHAFATESERVRCRVLAAAAAVRQEAHNQGGSLAPAFAALEKPATLDTATRHAAAAAGSAAQSLSASTSSAERCRNRLVAALSRSTSLVRAAKDEAASAARRRDEAAARAAEAAAARGGLRAAEAGTLSARADLARLPQALSPVVKAAAASAALAVARLASKEGHATEAAAAIAAASRWQPSAQALAPPLPCFAGTAPAAGPGGVIVAARPPAGVLPHAVSGITDALQEAQALAAPAAPAGSGASSLVACAEALMACGGVIACQEQAAQAAASAAALLDDASFNGSVSIATASGEAEAPSAGRLALVEAAAAAARTAVARLDAAMSRTAEASRRATEARARAEASRAEAERLRSLAADAAADASRSDGASAAVKASDVDHAAAASLAASITRQLGPAVERAASAVASVRRDLGACTDAFADILHAASSMSRAADLAAFRLRVLGASRAGAERVESAGSALRRWVDDSSFQRASRARPALAATALDALVTIVGPALATACGAALADEAAAAEDRATEAFSSAAPAETAPARPPHHWPAAKAAGPAVVTGRQRRASRPRSPARPARETLRHRPSGGSPAATKDDVDPPAAGAPSPEAPSASGDDISDEERAAVPAPAALAAPRPASHKPSRRRSAAAPPALAPAASLQDILGRPRPGARRPLARLRGGTMDAPRARKPTTFVGRRKRAQRRTADDTASVASSTARAAGDFLFDL